MTLRFYRWREPSASYPLRRRPSSQERSSSNACRTYRNGSTFRSPKVQASPPSPQRISSSDYSAKKGLPKSQNYISKQPRKRSKQPPNDEKMTPTKISSATPCPSELPAMTETANFRRFRAHLFISFNQFFFRNKSTVTY